MLRIKNFIDGQFQDPRSGSWLPNYTPASGEVFAQIADSNAEDINTAVAAAQRACKPWAQWSAEKRSQLLYRIADLLETKLQAFAEAESQDQGKPVALARTMDIPRAIANFRFFAGAILHHQEQATHMDLHALNYTLRRPVGVCGLITPWNLPLYLLTWKLAPALACGNTVVCKPSELTSLTAFLLCEVLQQAQLPPGVVNMVFGRGPTAGQRLAEHPDVPLLSFTGGTETGQKIALAGAPHFKKISLELGGKNANVIFDDADLDLCVATTVRSSFLNQGEICLCGSRILVQKNIADKFLEKFVAATQKWKVGNPAHEKTDLGALVSLAHLEKVEKYIALARSEGAVVLTGGKRPELEGTLARGYFLEPTILTGLQHSSQVCQEEIFGPVVTVNTFETQDEAIALANDTRYGLSASVWTSHLKRAHHVAANLDVGTLWINGWMMRDLRVPFGGVKASGLGREGGEHSLDFYSEVKNVCLKL